MNGQLYHLIKVIDSSNKSLKNKKIDKYEDEKYIKSVLFKTTVDNSFISKLFRENKIKVVARSLMEWYEYLKVRNCKRVYAKLVVNADDRNLSAFANGVSGQFMICIYNGYYEVWRNVFEYNEKNWDVQYHMIQKINEKFILEDVDHNEAIDNLIECYLRIGNFALEIKEEHWSKFFYSGKEHLERMKNDEEFDIEQLLVNIKWPFGGMGSWNDSPPYSAHQLGREDEFKLVSDKLYKAIHTAVEATLNKS
ncbi:hypothetical protein [Inediibacterium massiliense]|uniref:hypothetical protein n=1 Tax=Inediibacterium massiliense TaxID=1658111 RepID=UPI0006B5B88F|nr:hypothetical protein [Inediibacterium massiliense]